MNGLALLRAKRLALEGINLRVPPPPAEPCCRFNNKEYVPCRVMAVHLITDGSNRNGFHQQGALLLPWGSKDPDQAIPVILGIVFKSKGSREHLVKYCPFCGADLRTYMEETLDDETRELAGRMG